MNGTTAKWMTPRKRVITTAIDVIIENVERDNRQSEIDDMARLCVSKYVCFSSKGNVNSQDNTYLNVIESFKREIVRRMRLMGEY